MSQTDSWGCYAQSDLSAPYEASRRYRTGSHEQHKTNLSEACLYRESGGSMIVNRNCGHQKSKRETVVVDVSQPGAQDYSG